MKSRIFSRVCALLTSLALAPFAISQETKNVLMQSNVDTSSAAIAPPWSMKPWLWEDDVNTAEAVWDLVDGCKQHDLPLGAILLDSPWSTRYNNFRFDEKRYPNPRAMIDALHR